MSQFSGHTGILWGAISAVGLSFTSMMVGFTLLLGTLRHRKVGLPMVWISAAILVAAGTALVLILVNSPG